MAGGNTIATAWVQIALSAQGIGGQLKEELNPLSEKADEEGKGAARGFFSNFKEAGTALAGAAGVALGGLLTKGFLDSVNAEAGTDTLAAQLGIQNPDYAKDLGKIAGKVYVGNFGDSLPQVNEALKSVLSNGLLPEDAGNADIQRITEKALTLNQVFGSDLAGSTKAVAQLIKTGLAGNADEAFDVITRGYQQGADVSGDFLDTLNEYPIQFKKLGLDAATATGILSQGMKAGARDSDVVADSLKEFSIRAVDGSKTTADGFKALGLDAGVMAERIGAGGDSAASALDETLDKLRAIPDPVARSQAAVALFGTQAEDLGDALFALDPSKAVKGLGDIGGAADRVAAQVGDNTAAKFETFKRKVEVAFQGIGGAIGPVLSVAPGIAGLVAISGQLGPVLGAAGTAAKVLGSGMLSLVGSTASLALAGAKLLAQTLAQTVAWAAQKAAQLAGAVATGVMTAAQWLLNVALTANPIGLIVVAIGALIAAFVLAYNKIGPFRDLIDAIGRALVEILGGAIDWVREHWPLLLAILTGPIGIAVLLITKYWDQIRDGVAAVIDWVINAFGAFIDFFRGLPGEILNALASFGNLLVDKGRQLLEGLIRGYLSYISFVYNTIIGLAGQVISWIGDAASWLYGKGQDVIRGLINGITSWLGSVAGTISNIPGIISRAIGDATSWLYNVGRQIIEGMINGITDMVGAAVDAVKKAVGSVISGAKSLLGIGSPSKVFREIGVNVGKGLVGGLESMRPKIQNSVENLGLTGPDFGNISLASRNLPSLTAPNLAPTNGGIGTVNVYAPNASTPERIASELSWNLLTRSR